MALLDQQCWNAKLPDYAIDLRVNLPCCWCFQVSICISPSDDDHVHSSFCPGGILGAICQTNCLGGEPAMQLPFHNRHKNHKKGVSASRPGNGELC